MNLATPQAAPALPNRPAGGLLAQPRLWDTAVLAEGREHGGDGTTVDHLAGFRAAIVNVRLATAAVSLVLAGTGFARADWPTIVASLVVVANTGYRSLVPLTYTGSPVDQARLLLEVALFWAVLALTGFWQSPMVIASTAILVVAGFAGGFRLALRIGASTTISLTIAAFATTEWTSERMDEAVQWTGLLLLTAIIAGYGRRISGEANRRNSANLDRITKLTDANTLLFNLHRLAQTLPASLDRKDVLNSSLVNLRPLLDFDRGAIFLIDDTDGTWAVARSQAVDVGADSIDPMTLPETARRALAGWRTTRQPDGGLAASGLHPSSVGGLYAPLAARSRLIGLIAVESDTRLYDERDRQALNAFIEPLALAIDNASLFARLRQASVDEERSRIARDLHDRIGQSLASLGFDVDNLVRHQAAGLDVSNELAVLREGVRAATTEVREALYDLRSDVAEDKDLEHVIAEFAGRVAARSELTVNIDSRAEARLPLMQEREMWRIAQESVVNVERHAEASTVTIRWRCDDGSAELEVTDDGRGMDAGRGRSDSYGIVGMRERASSIGASLEIQSEQGEGTTVRCYLSQR
jgi:signal transduction histidine kinase